MFNFFTSKNTASQTNLDAIFDWTKVNFHSNVSLFSAWLDTYSKENGLDKKELLKNFIKNNENYDDEIENSISARKNKARILCEKVLEQLNDENKEILVLKY